MSTLRSPVGPQPPSVYWRRRVFALLGLLAVIVVIVLIVSSLVNGSPNAGASKSPTPSDTATTAPTPTSAAGGEACNPAQLTIVAVTDADKYASGVKPQISMKLTNAGSAPCTLDVNPAEQEYLITSGSDRIWSSKDCQAEGAATPVLMEPGVTRQTEAITWDRTRSSTDTCDGTRPAAVAGPDGPTYKLQVKLGTLESELKSFRLY
jgi:hypothetical protein